MFILLNHKILKGLFFKFDLKKKKNEINIFFLNYGISFGYSSFDEIANSTFMPSNGDFVFQKYSSLDCK